MSLFIGSKKISWKQLRTDRKTYLQTDIQKYIVVYNFLKKLHWLWCTIMASLCMQFWKWKVVLPHLSVLAVGKNKCMLYNNLCCFIFIFDFEFVSRKIRTWNPTIHSYGFSEWWLLMDLWWWWWWCLMPYLIFN